MANDSWRSLYPFGEKRFDRGNGIRMHYLDEGRGDPVLMVHGNPTWSFYYRDLAKTLVTAGHRAIAPDHVGMGFSDCPPDGDYQYTLQSRVDDLERLMATLNPGPVTLVVHDWGGPIGLCWALRDMARVKALVVLNTAGFLPPESYKLPWQLGASRSFLGPLLVQGGNAFVDGLIKHAVMRPMAPAVEAGYRAPYDGWGRRRGIMRFVQDIPRGAGDKAYGLMGWLGNNVQNFQGVPTMIGWGLRDFVFDRNFLQQWKARLPSAEVREYPNAGHLVLEDASPELLPAIRDFAKKNGVRR